MTAWPRRAKIAFVGSHGIRKTTAAYAFAHTIQRAGRSVEFGREVVRDNPLGINETATGEAQLWVLVSQVRQELELAPKAEVLVTDRGVVDNYAYYLRACGGTDRFDIEPLVRNWGATYDLVVRLTPDIELRADGIGFAPPALRSASSSKGSSTPCCRASCVPTDWSRSRHPRSPTISTGGRSPNAWRRRWAHRSSPRAWRLRAGREPVGPQPSLPRRRAGSSWTWSCRARPGGRPQSLRLERDLRRAHDPPPPVERVTSGTVTTGSAPPRSCRVPGASGRCIG